MTFLVCQVMILWRSYLPACAVCTEVVQLFTEASIKRPDSCVVFVPTPKLSDVCVSSTHRRLTAPSGTPHRLQVCSALTRDDDDRIALEQLRLQRDYRRFMGTDASSELTGQAAVSGRLQH